MIGVSNSLEAFRASAELTLKVYLSMGNKIHGFAKENQAFQMDSEIGVSNSLEAFRACVRVWMRV